MSRFGTCLAWILISSCATCGGDEDQTTPPQTQTEGPALLDQQGALVAGQGAPGRATHDIPVNPGDALDVVLTSSAFDPVLELTPPGAGTLTNDDFGGSRTESRLSVLIAEAGVLKVTVTSASAQAAGAYHVVVRRRGAGSAAPTVPVLAVGTSQEGQLAAGDETLPDGRFSDRFVVAGGDAGPVELRIEAVGDAVPLAIVLAPGGTPLSASASGVYAISQPGPHRLQMLSPAPGAQAGYRVALSAASRITTPTLARSHHQLPQQTVGRAVQVDTPVRGQLGDADDTPLPTGEAADLYVFQGAAGQSLRVEHRSDAFDTYLMVIGPDGRHWENDDSGGTTSAALDLDLPVAGTYRIVATAYRAGLSGAYELKVGSERGTTVATLAANPTPSGPADSRNGALAQGDRTLQSGELVDSFGFDWPAGASFEIRLTSAAFDPYLIVKAPDGSQQDNDDESPGITASRLVYTAAAAGHYEVLVTSYRPGETGDYTLTLTPSSGAVAAVPTPTTPSAPSTPGQTLAGALAQGDETLQSGELVDTHVVTLAAGERVRIEARSSAFDSYLIVREPGGQQHDNDDPPGGGSTNAVVDFVATQAGEHRVLVTSYRPGETGAYELVVSRDSAGGTPSTPTSPTTPTTPSAPATPVTGDSVRGALAQGDQTLRSGEFSDSYQRTFEPGQSVQIRLSSSAFDPYVIVRTPSGQQLDNDDLDPSTRDAGVDIPATEAGTYSILVTSYRAGETGAYELTFGRGASVPRPADPGSTGGGDASGGRIFGLFAGITDYPDGVGDLPECANDAIKLAQALRERGLLDESRQVVLTDGQATRANMTSAMQRFSQQMGPDDIFVFFYSGHGGQTQGSSDAREIDGTDEYLVLHDGPMLDDQLARLFDPVRARLSVIALDACFSGGFAKDLITRPGRVGYFSSEEDVLSAVASQFQAGGYLSHFLRLAVSGEADLPPRDRVLTVGEMSHFLYTQFGTHATDVQLQGAYQHLVVDRGAVRSDQVLWSYR
ncbi:MAG: caspase family protein [Sandaracinus sp.]|nr:caspase family protein [Sandaracinus sp.]